MSLDKINWWELPDNTLVRDSKGELRRVHHSDDAIWLEHWSDEYASWYDDAGLHQMLDEDADQVTVIRIVNESR